MKKMICAWIVCLCAAVFAGENLLPNENMLEINQANKPSGWWGNIDPQSGVDTEITPEKGVNSMRMAGDKMLQTDVKIKGGHIYKGSFLLKTEGFKWKTSASFQIIWKKKGKYLMTDYNGQQIWNMKIKNVQGGHNWDKIEITDIVAPAEADGATIRIGQVFDPAGKFWISKWRLEEVENGNPFQNRIAAIPMTREAMTMEKAIDENAWSKAAKLSGYLLPSTGANAKFASESFVMYDKDALWILFRNFQPNADKLAGNDMKRFDTQDAIEFLLQLPGRKLQYHIILPVSGKLWLCQEQWDDPKWPRTHHPWPDNGITFKIKQFPDRWIAAVRVPFSGLQLKTSPSDGTEWLANFCRSVQTGAKEETAWPFLKENLFQFTPSFGKIIFTEKTVPQFSDITIDAGGASLKAVNTGSQPVKLDLAFVKHMEKQSFVEAGMTRKLAPGEAAICDLNFLQKTGDMRFLEIRANDTLVLKHSGMPVQEYLAMGVFDPENVRSQTLYLAIDTPFFIGLNMRHNFPSQDKRHLLIMRDKEAFDIYLEVPASLNFSGMTVDTGDWLKVPLIKPSSVETISNGAVKRYKFEMPFILKTDSPYFLFFYECSAPENQEYTGSYHFTHNGKAMPAHELKFKTMKVGSVRKPFEKMVVNPGLLSGKTLRWWFPRDTIKHYKRLGFNRLEVICERMRNKEFYTGDKPVTNEDFYDLIIKEAKDSGEKLFISTFITSSGIRGWQWTDGDPDARAIGYDGKQVPNQYNYPALCPSYRGKYYREWLDFLINTSVFAKYKSTWLGLDMELWPREAWNKICFCKRCLGKFHEHCLKKGRKDFASLDAAKIIAEGKNKEFADFWHEFKRDLYEDIIREAAAKVEESVKGSPSTAPLNKFVVSDWTSPDSLIRDRVLDYFEVAFFNSPDNNFTAMKEKMTKWDFRKDLYCSTTYGQTTACPDFHVTPEQVKENLFESAAFGMQGVSWYYVIFLEPRRMKAVIDGLNALRPFEDLILAGKYGKTISGSNPKQQLTRLDGEKEMLVGVRAYGAQEDQTGVIRLENIPEKMNVYDCETGEKLGMITLEKPEFSCKVKKNHMRLLYVGPEAKWNVRQKAMEK